MTRDALWTCKIGPADRDQLPSGSDGPMRMAVEAAFKELTGHDAEIVSSGWGGTLSAEEKADLWDKEHR